MTVTLKELFFRTVAVLMVISMELCCGSNTPKSYGPSPATDNNYQNNYDPEFQRPLAVFTERPVNVAGFVLIPVIQVPSSDLRMIYRPQIDSVSRTEPIVMCKSSAKSIEATPAVQVPLQQPFYLYDERTLIPFPKAVTILHGGYRMSIPVGVVVAPVPVGAFRTGPVFVTTLFAIPAGPLPAPSQIPIRFVPYSSSPPAPQYSAGPPASPPQYLTAGPPSPPQYPAAPPAHPSSQYSAPGHPLAQYSAPGHPSPQYSVAGPPAAPAAYPAQYSAPGSNPSPHQYSAAAAPAAAPAYPPSTQYSQAAPPSPAYYQHTEYAGEEGGGDNDLRYRDPPGQLLSHYTAPANAPPHYAPFHNSKESPLLHQLREQSEKDRKKYATNSPPPYTGQYQTVDA